jgi:protein-tyrosine phosphatase
MGICEMHCHLLPGIDDGRVDRDGFERMLLVYKESGINSIAFTPHVYNPYVTTNIPNLRDTYSWAAEIAASLGMATYLGSELFVGTQEVLKGIPIGKKYFLVEFPVNLPPADLFPRLEALAASGMTLIVAHVERYRWLDAGHPSVVRLKEIGALLQVNVEGVESGAAVPYLDSGLADLVATDNHGDETLPYRLLAVLDTWPGLTDKMEKLGL